MSRSPSELRRVDGRAGRFYAIDEHVSPLTGDERFPSVTHILSVLSKPALVTWAATTERALVLEAAADLYEDARHLKPMPRAGYLATLEQRLGQVRAHQKAQARALEIGSQAHALIEHQIRKGLGQKVGPEPRTSPEALWAVMSAEDWFATHTVKPRFVEVPVWHPTLGYAGTVDLVAEVDGVLAVIDWKTSKGLYAESDLQNVAYQAALAAMGHTTPQAGYVIRIPKTTAETTVEVKVVPPVAELLPTFTALCQVWRWWWAAEQANRAKWEASR